jgi:hypothetical protein
MKRKDKIAIFVFVFLFFTIGTKNVCASLDVKGSAGVSDTNFLSAVKACGMPASRLVGHVLLA